MKTKEVTIRWDNGAFLIIRDSDLFNLIRQGGFPVEIQVTEFVDDENYIPNPKPEDFYYPNS